MKQQDFLKLLDRYLEGSASAEEEALLLNYFNSFPQETDWKEEALGNPEEVGARMWQQLQKAVQERSPVVSFYKRAFFRYAAAAVLLFAVGALGWWAVHTAGKPPALATAVPPSPFPPPVKIDKATLILDDGKQIVLDSAADGLLAQQGNTTVKKEGAKLVYQTVPKSPTGQHAATAYHQILTPRGVQYQVVLPDGSHVWINAVSSLRFPTAFAASERRVEASGEAYFEVAKEAGRPFRVHVTPLTAADQKGAVVEVLGTHFNINAYGDEQVLKTTLLEGSVKVHSVSGTAPQAGSAPVLLPGQQAQIAAGREAQAAVQVKKVDVEEVVAWKNNLFNFNTADIETIMREIARWYDVEVVYEGKTPVRNFSGKISRNAALSTVLKILEQSNIHFRLRNRKIIVTS